MQTQSNELDFNGQNFYCGVDIHKNSWTVTLTTEETILRTFTQDADSEMLVRYLKRNYPGGNYKVGYESGYFGFNLYRYLKSKSIECLVIHPADIPTTHKEKDQKRDPLDSRKIARILRNGDAKSIWVPPVYLEQDRQLLRSRRALTKDYVRIKNRIKGFLEIHGIRYPDEFKSKYKHWSKRFIKWLEDIKLQEPSGTYSLQSMIRSLVFIRGEILTVTRNIRALSLSPRYNAAFSKLVQISGIGMLTAMIILTETGTVSRFKTIDTFRSYIGIIPRAHCSGDKDYHGRMTNRGNSHMLSLLVESAWSAIRKDPQYLLIYKNYKSKMPHNKALIRTTRKLVNNIYYALKEVDY